jgi:hypothetical protein
MQEINVKEETIEKSSSSTLGEDHEARHKSRHMINMTPKGPRTEASTRKAPRYGADKEGCESEKSGRDYVYGNQVCFSPKEDLVQDKVEHTPRLLKSINTTPQHSRVAIHSPECRQIEGDTSNETDSCRKSLSCLVDGLDHAPATMVGFA